MRAVILAAGRGSRMKSVTNNIPKCLLKVRGKTLLDHQLEALRSAGIDDIAVVTGYKRETLSGFRLHQFHNTRWAETNMLYSLSCAKKWLADSPCIVSYSDIFYDTEAITSLINCQENLSITFDPQWLNIWSKRFLDPLSDAETFKFDIEGYLTEIGNRPRSIDDISGQYMGLLRTTPRSWLEIEQVKQSMDKSIFDTMHITAMLQRIIDIGNLKIKAIPYNGVWGEIDSEEDLYCY